MRRRVAARKVMRRSQARVAAVAAPAEPLQLFLDMLDNWARALRRWF